ncbi:PREDICTED: RNA polymerase II C-terminal domain phosphatase-like 1 [Camelina sativa]|uniref:RNA polymerase II C-terminal domain phosphatase-like 1 n=1 Tax=Camelina sativa TaxID=90675 RepID=A0ABM0V5Y1_CAMSA|nr:PREDICTED: RNA polymerase II C-terminal domain phosphatase-like 1 [Camelina sativa]
MDFLGEEASWNQSSSRNSDLDFLPERSVSATETSADVLHGIAIKCGAKVEYKPSLVASTDLRFSVEAWLSGEKIGEGTGKSRREALHKAAEASIQNLADVYMRSHGDSVPSHRDASPFTNGNMIMGNANALDNQPFGRDETSMPVPSRPTDPRLEGSMRHTGSITALRELCASEGFEMAFQSQRPLPSDMVHRDELHAQVEIDGRVLGEGVGSTWDEARMQAAERALSSVRSMLGQPLHKRQGSPRSFAGMSNKRLKPDFQRSLQRMPSSGRYS